MRNKTLVILAFCAATASPAVAQSLLAAPRGASACSGCHGAAGGAVPALQGRKADDIVAALAAFREGRTPATVMDRIAKGFSADESLAIARWLEKEKQP